ncbi:MAG: hypothetical protein JXB35_09685 [Anaerolineae bacterium]|nr:hypothetical protein [Anaerolineae bacterium]
MNSRFKQSGIKSEWLHKDKTVLAQIKTALPFDEQSLTDLPAIWNLTATGAHRDLGFGGRLHSARLPGGYTSITITLVSFENAIVAAAVRQQTWNNPEVLPLLEESWGGLVHREEKELCYAYRNPRAQMCLREAIHQALGCWEADTPAELQPAYATLMDPLESYEFGTYCGVASVPPKGRVAIEDLKQRQAWDLIRAVLRSPNPEGRVYAIETLLALEQAGNALSPQDQRAIEALLAMEIPVSVCGGCFTFQKTAKELFAGKPDASPVAFGF